MNNEMENHESIAEDGLGKWTVEPLENQNLSALVLYLGAPPVESSSSTLSLGDRPHLLSVAQRRVIVGIYRSASEAKLAYEYISIAEMLYLLPSEVKLAKEGYQILDVENQIVESFSALNAATDQYYSAPSSWAEFDIYKSPDGKIIFMLDTSPLGRVCIIRADRLDSKLEVELISSTPAAARADRDMTDPAEHLVMSNIQVQFGLNLLQFRKHLSGDVWRPLEDEDFEKVREFLADLEKSSFQLPSEVR